MTVGRGQLLAFQPISKASTKGSAFLWLWQRCYSSFHFIGVQVSTCSIKGLVRIRADGAHAPGYRRPYTLWVAHNGDTDGALEVFDSVYLARVASRPAWASPHGRRDRPQNWSLSRCYIAYPREMAV
jgi:hypothetical protein